jgi:hypothetical protein
MTDIELTVLKSLAMRPCLTVSPFVRPIVIVLLDAGYVVHGASGWMATELGCVALENKRAIVGW